MFSLPKDSIIFGPLEGYTDAPYRKCIEELYPEYDFLFTDFLRASSSGSYPKRVIEEHIGAVTPKTVVQILSSEKGDIETLVKMIEDHGAFWLDLNLGCPSKSVIAHGGGAYLLDHHEKLIPLIRRIRKTFTGFFSCKMRVGMNDDKQFLKTIKLFESEGVNALTIHSRLRTEFYKGSANWDYVAQAVKEVKIPIIGSGDIWSYANAKEKIDKTSCHTVMCARGALKTPWLGRLIKEKREETLTERKIEILRYVLMMEKEFIHKIKKEEHLLKRMKSLCYFLFDPLPNGKEIKTLALRSENVDQFLKIVNRELV